jgi:predicted RNA-binding protein with PUA domain
MTIKYNKISDKKYEIINNGQVIGIVFKNENSNSWTATTIDGTLEVIRPSTRKRAVEGLIWNINYLQAD